MDERQSRLLVVLSAAVIAAGLVWLLVPTEDDTAPWDAAADVSVWQVQADTVTRVVLEQRNLPKVVVEKVDGVWQVREPAPGLADAPRVEGLLDALARLEVGIPVTGSDAAELGLGEPPVGRVTLTTPAGDVRLDLGDKAPVGWQTYGRTGQGQLVVLPGHFEQDVLVDPTTFQDAALVRFNLAAFQRLVMESPGGTLDVTRDDANAFWLAGYGRADAQAVENALLTFAELRFDAFADHLAPDGLTIYRHRASITTQDGRTVEVRFGDTLPIGRLAQGAEGRVGVVANERLAFLDQGPTDMLDRRAFPMGSERADQVAVSLDGASAVLEGGEATGWKAIGLDAAAGAALHEALRKARIDWKAPGPVPTPGASTGRVTVREGESRSRVVELYQVDGAYRIAKDASGGNPYRIPEADLQEVKRLLPASR